MKEWMRPVFACGRVFLPTKRPDSSRPSNGRPMMAQGDLGVGDVLTSQCELTYPTSVAVLSGMLHAITSGMSLFP